jgi:hypothetical protein
MLFGKVAEIPLNVSISYKAFLKEIEEFKKLFFPTYSNLKLHPLLYK